jgi:hypothetical protein
MKTYVITFSRNFLKSHPAAGEPTHFVESILEGSKTTTIRGNYQYWKKVARAVNNKEAILSMRFWKGAAYKSKQQEFARCTKLSTKRVFATNDHNGFEMSVNGQYQYRCDIQDIIEKEGFKDANNFYDWFSQDEFSGIMLGFLELEKV